MASGRAWQKFLQTLTRDERKMLTDYVGGDAMSPNEYVNYQLMDPKDSINVRGSKVVGAFDQLFRRAPQPRRGLELYRGLEFPMKEGEYPFFMPTSKNPSVAEQFGEVHKIRTTPNVRYLDMSRILPKGSTKYVDGEELNLYDPFFTDGGTEQEFLLPRRGALKQLGDREWLYDYLNKYSEGGPV